MTDSQIAKLVVAYAMLTDTSSPAEALAAYPRLVRFLSNLGSGVSPQGPQGD